MSITPAFCSAHLGVASPALQSEKSWTQNRGIHDICLPLHSDDTVYTRSAHAFSRAQAKAQMEIAELKRAVEARDAVVREKDAVVREKDAVVREKDAVIRDLRVELAQKRGVVQQLEVYAQGGRGSDGMMEGKGKRADGMVEQRAESAVKVMGDISRGADVMVGERVVMADAMMELMREMRESRREAYDPL